MIETPRHVHDSGRHPDDVASEEHAAAADVHVTLSVAARDEIRSIAVAGDFNEWSATSHPMARVGRRFVITILLRAGHRHRYQYVVDGTRRENDWHADDYEESESGAVVSVVDLRSRAGTAASMTSSGGSDAEGE